MTVRRMVAVVLALVLVPVAAGTSQVAAEDRFDRPHIPGQLVVRFRTNDGQQREQVHRSVGTRLRQRLLGRDVVATRSSADLRDVAARYLRDSRVSFVEPVYTVRPRVIPNDPRFPSQWGLHNTGQTGGTPDADIDAPEAWDIATSTPVRIAIMDTGYDTSHPDLAPNHVATLQQGACPIGTNCGHGTLIAGVAAARGNNGTGVSGTVWQAGLLNVPFDFTSTGVVEALDDLISYSKTNGVRIVVAASFGADGSCPEVVSAALDRARAQGLLFVTAAGNDSLNNDQSPDWPSNCPQDNVIAVTSTNDQDQLASFSNIGPNTVDIAAPGTDIETTRAGGGYTQSSGTSISVPFVTGAAALVWGHEPSLTYAGVRSRLFSTVDKLPSLEGRILTGGRLNMARAMGATPDSGPSPTPAPTPAPPGTGNGSISGTAFSSAGSGFLCLFFGCGPEPLADVTVSAAGKTAVTGSGGRYTLADLPPGTYTVTASATGTTGGGFLAPPTTDTVACSADSTSGPASKTVTVPAGGNVQVDWYCPTGGGGGGFFNFFGLFFGSFFG